jgi:hypothetical protein
MSGAAAGFDVDIIDVFALGMKREIVPWGGAMAAGPVLNLGAGNSLLSWDRVEIYEDSVVDLDLPDWDANSGSAYDRWTGGTVGAIIAFHFLEHVNDPIWHLWQWQRLLSPGGAAWIVVPYYNSQMMAHDLTHKHAFCEDTWKILFQNDYYNGPFAGQWKLSVGTNVIIGVAERNLCLMTQLVKI